MSEITGVEYVMQQHLLLSHTKGREHKGSVIIAAIASAVAAENENDDACKRSPSSAEETITVGASDTKDTRASFSNRGSCTDVFAPGVDLLSTWIGNPKAKLAGMGTSMATSHVAGLIAYYLSLAPNTASAFYSGTLSPKQMKELSIGLSAMTSSYRINYQLRAHKRDPLIEFIKGLLLTPFILHAKPRKPVLTSPVVDGSDIGGQHGGGSGSGPNNQDDDRNDYQEEEKPMVDANLQRYLEIMKSVEVMIEEHRRKALKGVPEHSRLHRIVPSVATFFTSLPLETAFLNANAKHSIAARRFVPPSFNDIRRILNTAQVMAIAPTLRLITFDGDMTLYDDGTSFTDTSPLISLLITLMRANLRVAIVTAAGYPGDAGKYEERLAGLLRAFQKYNLSEKLLECFYVLGGECNYLFRCGWKKNEASGEDVVGLTYIQPETYQPEGMLAWKPDEIQEFLDVAEENLRRCVSAMNLKATILRKSRAVGIVPLNGAKIAREQLDECVLSTQQRLLEYQQMSGPSKVAIPFCAFNGGNDVFVDIGNKLIGVQVLQSYLGAAPDATLHVGDQFLSTGNDFATRSSCCTLWIVNPEETESVLKELTPLLRFPAEEKSEA